jgi:phosphatidylinositol alpha-1,6-mannosyltransferase
VRALGESRLVEQLDLVALGDPLGCTPDPHYWPEGPHSYTACGGSRARFSYEVIRRMRRSRYTRVLSGHVYLTPLPFLASLLGGWGRVVTFVYGIDATARLPWFRRVPLLRSGQVIAISQFTADLMAMANAVPQTKIRVLHNCLDPVFSTRGESNEPIGSALEPFVANSILTVSRLSRDDTYKGHQAVLSALPDVLVHVPDAVYYIVGQGALRCDLEQQVDSLGLRDNVRFLGRVSDADLARCYKMARVFVMPSKAEGFGFVFLEAMAYGRPVVAGNRDAAPEVLGNGEAGLLVDPDDVQQIASALTRILVNPDLRELLGTAGRARAEQLFGYALFKSQLETYLLDLDTHRRHS